ncbi:hypothetical protein D3C87_1164580 [compost metagenome]
MEWPVPVSGTSSVAVVQVPLALARLVQSEALLPSERFHTAADSPDPATTTAGSPSTLPTTSLVSMSAAVPQPPAGV